MKFWEKLGEALKGEEFDKAGVPEQTEALARIYWPLTVSTNYDHLFYCACRQSFEDRLDPLILGRNGEDCKQVLSSLVSPFDREIIWHIQGFLGEVCPKCHLSSTRNVAQLERLRSELVIGHAEYRRAASTAIHFRRCFGEVFRSCSFLFLGSSLSEEYFWNLFGETIELCGPSPVPHFAFLPSQQEIDVRFLVEEMNITVCEYNDHSELPKFLERLKNMIEKRTSHVSEWHVELDGGFSLEVKPHTRLPMPDGNSDAAVAIVVKACPEGRFELDRDLCDQLFELRSKFEKKPHFLGRSACAPRRIRHFCR